MNQLKKKMIPLAMAMALVATGFAGNLAVQKTAFAEGRETPKTLIIKKVLTMPSEGVATPAETFNFEFTKVSFNGKAAEKDTCPTISNISTAYTAADATDGDSAKEGKQVIKSTSDILNGINWQKAGQYVYTVTEKQASTSGMEYSKASYTLSIIVASEGGTLKVKYVGIKKDKEDNGNTNPSARKVEHTPDGEGSTNNFVFENKYFPKKGNDTPGKGEVTQQDKNGLAISKKVEGENTSNTQPFKFTMKIDKPEGLADGQTYTYIVTTKGGTELPATETTVQYGQEQEITLTHGDKVVLKSVHMGAKASVTETDAAGYTPSVIVNCNGTSVPKAETNVANNIRLGDKTSGNSIEFTNTQQTPTGVIIDNLPFIILVAIAGMGILFFVRNKRRAEEF